MSQWTHLLGVIRFDSIAKNVWPVPPNKDAIIAYEMEIIKEIFSEDIPQGSEGPLQLDFAVTNRGPSIFITGDLRDFGYSDLAGVVDWVNEKANALQDTARANKMLIMVRDGMINCDVEGRTTRHLIIAYVNTEKEGLNYEFKLLDLEIKNEEKG